MASSSANWASFPAEARWGSLIGVVVTGKDEIQTPHGSTSACARGIERSSDLFVVQEKDNSKRPASATSP